MNARTLTSGRVVYRVHWRESGHQKNQTFNDAQGAERFRRNIEKLGPAQALAIIGLEDTGDAGETVAQACAHHINQLTGVQEGTRRRYRRYIANDLDEVGDLTALGALPLTMLDENAIAAWIQWLEIDRGNSGKTIANKHGFLYAALERAVRDGKIRTNPCEGTRLPDPARTREPRFLSAAEFAELRDAAPEYWRPLLTWLVCTGMRFGEATAVRVSDVSAKNGTCRIVRAWKYTGKTRTELGAPKTRKGRRLIDVPADALDVADLARPADSLLWTTPQGAQIAYPRFYEACWEPAVAKSGIKCTPHDLRHTCASWMILGGAPLPVVQQHLGHESITTTVGTYGHIDRASSKAAADIIGRILAGEG